MNTPDHATQLLNRLGAGEQAVEAELYEIVHRELHALAQGHMARERSDHTLQPTALVNEAWVRLFHHASEPNFGGRRQFYALASRVMRTLLVDHARRKFAEKRGGKSERHALDTQTPSLGSENDSVDTIDLDDALTALAESDPDLAQLVELRYFGGLTVQQTAETVDVSIRTAERRLRTATAWLRERLDG